MLVWTDPLPCRMMLEVAANVTAEPLTLEIRSVVVQALILAREHLCQLALANQSCLLQFKAFGKQTLKKLRVSPDAVLQAAFQVAYHRMHRSRRHNNLEAVSAYEAGTTKSFLGGRTEAIRPVTAASTTFVTKLLEHGKNEERSQEDKEQLRKLMRVSAITHRRLAQQAAAGHGVDRHLFALYVVFSLLVFGFGNYTG